MVQAIRQRVAVKPGGVIEIRSPELVSGTEADVIVLVDEPPTGSRSLSSFIGAGKGAFKSIEEVDAYIRELRDEWDR